MMLYVTKIFSRCYELGTLTPLRKKSLFIILGSLPVVAYVFKFSLLYRNGVFHGEDWDYFAQAYQAARQTILHYHQFPWWNPWSVGGEPLFANQQFGLFSIPMLLVLIFGTVPGLHYAIGIYFLAGFWGMYLLLKRLGVSTTLMAVLLSYIWVFSSFNVWHLGGGHFTFALYLVAPLAFWLLLEIHKPWRWFWFGIVASLMINAATHYLTIETLAICVIIAIIKMVKAWIWEKPRKLKAWWVILRPYVYASALALLLCSFKLIYALQFSKEYPKLEPLDPSESFSLFIASLFFRHPATPNQLSLAAPYGWGEYANYFGIITLGLLAYMLIRLFNLPRKITFQQWVLLGGTALGALLTLGAFAGFSPFGLLHHLPIFNQMRVPSRFICWFAFGVILLLAKLPARPIFYILLAISTLDVFAANFSILNASQRPYIQSTDMAADFQQHEFYDTSPKLGQQQILNLQNLRLLRATQNNQGEIYGYEPTFNIGEYYYLPGTVRCGIEQGCHFILSDNAIVSSWSPNHIQLTRTGPGPIKVNMNPGKVWVVNGKAVFRYDKIVELQKDFVITDTSKNISIDFRPVL